MGRKRLQMKKIENPSSRHVTYCKRKDGIVKKATELSVLCDTDVGLVMFSPTGRLTSFSGKGRVEDIFLHYIERPDELQGYIENKEHLYRSLSSSKYEGAMLDKIAKIEALEEKLCELNQRQHEALERMRFYNPDLEKINSVHDAEVHQQFLVDAIRCVENLKQEKLLGQQIALPQPMSVEVPDVNVKDADLTAEELGDSSGKRIPSRDERQHGGACLPKGPYLSIDYLKEQHHWNLQSGRHIPRLNIN